VCKLVRPLSRPRPRHERQPGTTHALRAWARTGRKASLYGTRIAAEDPDTPGEREKPVGHDGGYLWRLYTYCRFLERDGGTYVQCESMSLTRGIPPGSGWLLGPLVISIPRESLAFTLETTRTTLARRIAARDWIRPAAYFLSINPLPQNSGAKPPSMLPSHTAFSHISSGSRLPRVTASFQGLVCTTGSLISTM
jgi:hypothetical protein